MLKNVLLFSFVILIVLYSIIITSCDYAQAVIYNNYSGITSSFLHTK